VNSGTGEVSSNSEEYLEWIYRLSREQEEVTTTDLARSLKVSPASVTGMLKRLVERGLINHRPYHGIELTAEGRTVALKIIRRHGLLERLFTDVLGVPWHMADAEASRLEHAITEDVEERIAHLLGNPRTCPHGQPIDWGGPDYTVRLASLEAGAVARVARMGDESPDFLSYVETLGLLPGVLVNITGRAPFNGPLMVRVGEREHALGDEFASKIWVDRVDEEPAEADELATAAPQP
jgi:DtxR family transcriptional regulator, Mn-dependent transcriptional regulator